MHGSRASNGFASVGGKASETKSINFERRQMPSGEVPNFQTTLAADCQQASVRTEDQTGSAVEVVVAGLQDQLGFCFS